MDSGMLESLTQLGMIQKISTGNMLMDVALCALIPLTIKYAQPYLSDLWSWITGGWGDGARFTRTIRHIKREGYYHYDPSEKNHLLQEALVLYMGQQQKIVEQLEKGNVRLLQAENVKKQDDDDDDDDDKDSGSYYSDDSDTYLGYDLSLYRVNVQPSDGQWVDVETGVSLMRSETTEDHGSEQWCRDRIITITISSNRTDGNERIDAFINKCFEYYKQMKMQKQDPARYLFMPFQHSKESGEDSSSKNTMIYKRYKLSDEKSFDCYFHSEKEALVRLVEDFMYKRAKFQIKGYPHKLGLLLHGPPGTGKTSLIKAVAQYMKRSIVSVPLDKVKTNQELMDIMFDQRFLVQGEEVPMKLPHNKVIFVLEDVDACTCLLHRDNKVTTLDDAVLDLMGMDDSGSGAPFKKKGKKKKTDAAVQGPSMPKDMNWWMSSFDKLNLAGVLNVLDGVVDSPQRMIILTSNHPEKLDPALIRPGRINKILYLGYMTPDDATLMVRHYYPDAAEEDLEAFQESMVYDTLVPAKLEALCAEYVTVMELTAGLAKVAAEGGLAVEERKRTMASPAAAAEAAAALKAQEKEKDGEGEEDDQEGEEDDQEGEGDDQEGEGDDEDGDDSKEDADDDKSEDTVEDVPLADTGAKRRTPGQGRS